MKFQIGVVAGVVSACTFGAQAEISSALGLLIAATPIDVPTAEGAGLVDVDVSSMVHNNIQGSSWNKVMKLDVGEDLWVTGLSWDLSATTIDPMLLSDVSIAILNSSGDGVILTPFSDDEFTGSATSSSGVDLVNLRHSDQEFQISDGEIYIEFFLPFNPIPGPEATYALGSMLSLEISSVPAPGALAMGLGALGIAARRRR